MRSTCADGELAGRTVEPLQHGDERDHGAERQVAVDHQRAAEGEGECRSDRFEQAEHHLKPAADQRLLERRDASAPAVFLRTAALPLFSRPNTLTSSAPDTESVSVSMPVSSLVRDCTIRLRRLRARPTRRVAGDEERQKTDGDEGETPVEREDEDQRAAQDDRVLREVDQRAADHAADTLDVVEHVADRFARLLLGEEVERHVVQLPIDLDAEVEHDLLPDVLGVVFLHDLQQPGGERADTMPTQ